MNVKKLIFTIVLIGATIFLFSCGGAKVKVKNNCSFPAKEISIGDVSFSDILYPGQSSSYKDIKEGSYYPTFYLYSSELGVWLGFRAAESLEIEEGGFLSGDEEYTWTIYDTTLVTPL